MTLTQRSKAAAATVLAVLLVAAVPPLRAEKTESGKAEPNPAAQLDKRTDRKTDGKTGEVLAGPRVDPQAAKRSGRGLSGKRRGRGGRHQQMLNEVLKEMKLSEDQTKQVRQILADSRRTRQQFQKKHGKEFKALREQMRTARDAGDREQMRALATKRRDLMKRHGPREQLKQKLAKVLTPEQQKLFDARMKAHREKMRSRSKGRRGDGKKKGSDRRKAARGAKPRKREQPPPPAEPGDDGAEAGKLDL